MNRIHAMTVSMIVGVAAVVSAPVARAEESVTYEVFSDVVPIAAGIEYRDVSGKKLLQGVPLPWRATVPVTDPTSPTADGAELRADWRPPYAPAVGTVAGELLQGKYVTVRISVRGNVICDNTLYLGNAVCYGSVPHQSNFKNSPGNLP